MRKIKYSKSILVLLILIILLFTGCNFLKAVLPDTNEGTATTNTESTTGSNEETATTSNSGDNSNTGTNVPPDLGGVTEFVEQEVLVKIKPGADVDKIVSELGGTIIETLPQISVIRIKLEPQVSVAEAIQTLEELEEVEYAEPNGICYMDLVPNDADYDSQWAPQLTGAESAWDVTTGAAGVIIAITDTGVDGTHPDFEGKVIAGWDTYNNVEISAGADSSVNPHGTHCSGIAAAVGNNSQGIAGVAWESKIMPIRICDDGPYYIAYWSDMAEAFMWAADNGADIISCSFGGKWYSQTIKDAIDYAVIDMGCAMFASMGNSYRNEIMYPAGYQSVIAVGATNAHDEIASFSTTGNHMSVCAPGVEIYSTMPGGGYDYLSGTSMSCPFVAGAAALILSQNPGMSPEGVKTQLEETAFDLGSTGFDSTFGYGRVNLAAAVGAPEANKYGVVDVLVTDRLNHPISGASVILWQGETVISTTNSNEDGHAKFEYIQAGEYEISVSFPGFDSCLAVDNPVTVVAGGSVSKTIAFTTAEVYYVGAYAITYQGASTSASTSMELFQANMDQLVEEELIPDSFQLNELPPLAKGIVEHAIYVDWHSYPDATGYKVYRSINGGSFSLVFQDEPTTSYDWYSFWDYDVSEGNSYTYYVTAYDTGWETDPSLEVTIDTWLPPCSLISPTDESIITNPTPTFTWNPVGLTSSDFPYGSIYSGRSNLDIWNHTTWDWAWYIYFDDLTTSSAIYNQDGQATPLVAGNGYQWQMDSFGYDENGKLIAYSWSEYWDFYYGNIVADVGACAITYQDTSTGTSTSIGLFQANIDQLVEEELIPDSFQLNELPPLAKGIVGHAIDVGWHSYPDATGYKVYRSVNGASYILVLDWEAPPGYEWYGFGDWDVIPDNTYDYYVTAYGTGWETDPSQTVTIDTWLPPCTLNSPQDGASIESNPTFSWSSGAPAFPYDSLCSGGTCMLVYDLTTDEFVWIICFDDPYTSTATCNQDGQATPLISGHDYTWHSWTSGYDENWNRIAVSESEHWEFNYIGD
jgi:thermitase